MDDSLLIFVIPGFFLAICTTFILLNHCYYKIKGKSRDKLTSKVSVINISNIVNASPPSPTIKRKSRRSQSLTPTLTKPKDSPPSPKSGLDFDFSFKPSSSVILLNETDCPPSYQSLFDNNESSPPPSPAPQSKTSKSKRSRWTKKSKGSKVNSNTNSSLNPNPNFLHPSSAAKVNANAKSQPNESPYAVLHL